MFLLLVDAHLKWIKAHILSSTTSTSMVQCLRHIFSVFGLPEVLVTDKGTNFTSAEFEEFLRKNGIKHRTSALCHPSFNKWIGRESCANVRKKIKENDSW